MKKKKTPGEQEKELEKDGQIVLPTMPSHDQRGGARVGAGRPRLDPKGEQRAKHSLYCTRAELEAARNFLQQLRGARAGEAAIKEEQEDKDNNEDAYIYETKTVLRLREEEMRSDVSDMYHRRAILARYGLTLRDYYLYRITMRLDELSHIAADIAYPDR